MKAGTKQKYLGNSRGCHEHMTEVEGREGTEGWK